MRLGNHRQRISAFGMQDDGSALAGVIAVFAITLLLASLAANSTVNALGFTSATRSGVQSQASAEAGIAYVTGLLTGARCAKTTYTQSDVPSAAGSPNLDFSVKVSSRPDEATAWIDRCPGRNDNLVRLVSSGEPENVTGSTESGDVRRVEAVYVAIPQTSETNIVQSGASIYSYEGGAFNGSSQIHVGAGSPSAVVQIANGDAACVDTGIVQSGIYDASVVVAKGSFTAGGSCIVEKSLWALNNITVQGTAQVKGSTYSASLNMLATAIIHLDAFVGGRANMGATTFINGHLTAASRSAAGNPSTERIDPANEGQTWQMGDSDEIVPGWVDFAYRQDDWDDFQIETMGTTCNMSTMQAAVLRMAGRPGILDARGCADETTAFDGSGNFVLASDIVVIAAKKLTITGSSQFVSDDPAIKRKLWLIQPDEVDDDQPTCPKLADGTTDGSVIVGNSYIAGSQVASLIYSPCRLRLAGSAIWNGQFYGATVGTDESSQLIYHPIGLPGVNLSEGGDQPAPGDHTNITYATLGERLSIRDLSRN